jgi:hypothetical protein
MGSERDHNLALVTDPPAVHPSNAAAWSQVEASPLGDRMRRALRRVAAGESFREAATAEGYGTHSDVYRYARQYGLLSVKSELLVDRCREVAGMGLAELARRLSEDPESFSVKELGVSTGIMLDKIAKAERWGVEERGSSSGVEASWTCRCSLSIRPSGRWM